MSDYVPDYMDAQSYYVLGRATRRRNLTGQQAIDITPYSVEFDRFIHETKAEAWGEGATTALVHAGFVVRYDAPIFSLNPYKEGE